MNEERPPADSWDRRYRERDTPWDRGAPSPALLDWLDAGRIAGRTVLVPGCGAGHEVVLLAARGFEVTGVDFAESALEALHDRLHRRGLKAHLLREDLLAWQPHDRFDVVYEQTSLCALPPDRWCDYVAALAGWIRPGGELFALFMQTGRAGGPPWHCDPLAMQRLFRAPRWQWIQGPGDAVAHPAGFHELRAVLRRSAVSPA